MAAGYIRRAVQGKRGNNWGNNFEAIFEGCPSHQAFGFNRLRLSTPRRAFASGAKGRVFESRRAYHSFQSLTRSLSSQG